MAKVMEKYIHTNDNCTGCNRCIMACPVVDASVVVEEDGKSKIYINSKICINCAKCIQACTQDSRHYTDDTDAFLNALSEGKKISILVAPAIRTNFPEFERLLGQLRNMGASTIFDTSIGGDICTWGYIKYMEKYRPEGLISQPCPVVVNYIEKHDPVLIEKLSPVQSPAMCAAIYMKKYKNITDDIAFISPCIAKKDEFDDPNNNGFIKYNVTFNRLKKALKTRGIDYLTALPVSFDNDLHGLGAIFPMQGGLKANVHQFFPGVWIHQVEGQPEVKLFLDEYPNTLNSDNEAPFLVDILNCPYGCNLGTGANCKYEDSLRVNHSMFSMARDITGGKLPPNERVSLDKYDSILDLNDFIRDYTNKHVDPIIINPGQIEDVFISMHKTTEDDRYINCCCCGFDTCRDMAVSIAKGINHKGNCVEYHKREALLKQEHIRAILEYAELMIDSSPIGIKLLNKDSYIIEYNQAVVNLLRLNDKQGHIKNFSSLSPRYQPDGRLSNKAIYEYFNKAYKEGHCEFEWEYCASDGSPVPTHVTIVKVKYKNDDILAVYTRDLREIADMENKIHHLEEEAEKIYVDALTEIYNRRYFDEHIALLTKSLSYSGVELSLLMLDIDNFKKFNDTYGHKEGDSCLQAVAKILASCIHRSDDFTARYGGEEFVVVLPHTGEAGARRIAEKINKSVYDLNILHEKNDAGRVTISIGVTTGVVNLRNSGDSFVKRADKSLYEAKENGRNQYVFKAMSK